jgi:AcrR family transcriptional regulator
MAEVEPFESANQPAWRQRAVSRSLNAARSRAEQRVQRFLDAAFSLIDEKGSTEFTIQEVIDRSKQSLRAFYQYFDGKDELLLALFEETVGEATEDLAAVIESMSDPRKRGKHNRRPIMEFSVQLAVDHPERVKAAMAPISRMMVKLIEAANAAGAISVDDPRREAALVQQTVMYSWFGNRLAENSRTRLSADVTWEFCLHGLRGS